VLAGLIVLNVAMLLPRRALIDRNATNVAAALTTVFLVLLVVENIKAMNTAILSRMREALAFAVHTADENNFAVVRRAFVRPCALRTRTVHAAQTGMHWKLGDNKYKK
jgi:hypothetical protein